MRNVLNAIQTKFNADAALTARFADGCYLSLAHTDSSQPACVLNVVSAVPDYSTLNNVKVVQLQIDVYADGNADPNAAAFCFDALEELKSCFDFAELSLGSGDLTEMRRTNEGILREDEGVWHAFVEYEVWVTEDN